MPCRFCKSAALKSAACDISANWKNHDFGDRIARAGATSACVRSGRHHRTVRRSLCRIECGKTHTLDLFRHAAPVSGARFIAASRRSPLTMLAAKYVDLYIVRVEDYTD